jgi:hypothetical protein
MPKKHQGAPMNPKAPAFNPRPTHKQRDTHAGKVAGGKTPKK